MHEVRCTRGGETRIAARPSDRIEPFNTWWTSYAVVRRAVSSEVRMLETSASTEVASRSRSVIGARARIRGYLRITDAANHVTVSRIVIDGHDVGPITSTCTGTTRSSRDWRSPTEIS